MQNDQERAEARELLDAVNQLLLDSNGIDDTPLTLGMVDLRTAAGQADGKWRFGAFCALHLPRQWKAWERAALHQAVDREQRAADVIRALESIAAEHPALPAPPANIVLEPVAVPVQPVWREIAVPAQGMRPQVRQSAAKQLVDDLQASDRRRATDLYYRLLLVIASGMNVPLGLLADLKIFCASRCKVKVESVEMGLHHAQELALELKTIGNMTEAPLPAVEQIRCVTGVESGLGAVLKPQSSGAGGVVIFECVGECVHVYTNGKSSLHACISDRGDVMFNTEFFTFGDAAVVDAAMRISKYLATTFRERAHLHRMDQARQRFLSAKQELEELGGLADGVVQ